jgi:hypothetical protein
LSLLWDGLLHGDHWTMSKAIALLLKGGTPEAEVIEVIIRHVGRHIASSHGAEGGDDVARLINGLKVGQQYDGEDRLIALTTAASAAAGGAAERLEVIALSGTVSWEKIDRWVRAFSRDGQSGRIERCLFTAYAQGDQDKVLPLLFECAGEPNFIGFNLGYLAELVEEFGWDRAGDLACNLAGKMLGRPRGVPQEVRLEAINLSDPIEVYIKEWATNPPQRAGTGFDDEKLAASLVSGDIETAFNGITEALKSGGHIDQIVSTMVLLAADRMARTPVNMSPGSGGLAWEMNLASSVRTAHRYAGPEIAAKAIYQVAWQFFSDRWLNISVRSLRAPLGSGQTEATDESAALQLVLDSIEEIKVREIGRQVREYLNAGYSGDRLLNEMGLYILKDDNGWNLLHTLRTIFDEWALCAEHPARGQLLVGLARWATNVRRRTGSQSAAQTAQRFARGETAVELYE